MSPCAIYRGGTSNPIFFLEEIEDTIVHEIFRKAQPDDPPAVRIGHPTGTLQVEIEMEEQNGQVALTKAALARTARLLMHGNVCVG